MTEAPTPYLKLQVKAPLKRKPDHAQLIEAMHAWIREKRVTDDVLIDVADYAHMHEGPWALIVGHYTDFAYDQDWFGAGLQLNIKRGPRETPASSVESQIREALSRFKARVSMLQAADPSLADIDESQLRLRLNDRLLSEPLASAIHDALEALGTPLGATLSSRPAERDARELPSWQLSDCNKLYASL